MLVLRLPLLLLFVVFFTLQLLALHNERSFRAANLPPRVTAISSQRELPPRKVMHPQVEELECNGALRDFLPGGGSGELRWENEARRGLDPEVHVPV